MTMDNATTDDLFRIPRIPIDPACIAIPCDGRNGPVGDYAYAFENELGGLIAGLHIPGLNSLE